MSLNKNNDIVVKKGSKNDFEDLGFEAPEAANLAIRADLMLDLRQFIQDKGWTQQEAASFFGETQPRISNLINGDINRFSVDKLIIMLKQAGMEVKVEVIPQVA
ncbi:MAG: helix-turn-helix transcriptional regulator [Cyanobacteria bacterium P01_G01_bin.49]